MAFLDYLLNKQSFLDHIEQSRDSEGDSILNFDFNKNRCKMLSTTQEVKEDSDGILYWMCRDCRVQDNWAMLFAQRLALKQNLPLYVCFFLGEIEKLHPTKRHLTFLLKGLKIVKEECKSLNVKFCLSRNSPIDVSNMVKKHNIGCVISDFFPLKCHQEWKKTLLKSLPKDVPLVEVDAHNIVPAWIASEKQELAARTIRPKILKKLPEYLTEFPRVCKHPHVGKVTFEDTYDVVPKELDKFRPKADAKEITWAEPGLSAGFEVLHKFLTDQLKNYGDNDPSKEASSNLSPWLHFGQISAQRCALEVQALKKIYGQQVEKFLEELIVRRELTDNYCYYNENYDNLEGADSWAKITLNAHRKDKRTYLYTKEQFQNGETHDEIWNTAQLQLLNYGKIHGYMRMYWCKKILEWTRSPEEAIDVALYLNDMFSIDGNDPNGFVGVMWSICGVHDHGWKEREIFGKIRFMVDYSLRNKFDIDSYCAKYNSNLSTSSVQSNKRKAPSGSGAGKRKSKK